MNKLLYIWIFWLPVLLMSCDQSSLDSKDKKTDMEMILIPYKGVGGFKLGDRLEIDEARVKSMEDNGIFAITDSNNIIEMILVRNPHVKVENINVGVGDSYQLLQSSVKGDGFLLQQDDKIKNRRVRYKHVFFEIDSEDKIVALSMTSSNTQPKKE